ncbi:MAG: hypothetical protein JW774_11190 [Candidatus Aureabacteria bacterium]|nr:hypothetical protein [Candidatus Auribacterota bacterium]
MQNDFQNLTEEESWLALSPAMRFKNYSVLLDYYLRAGGKLCPEKDSQSPFDFPEYYQAVSNKPC